MAKSETAIAEPSKPEPIIRVSWPKDPKGGDIKVTGAEGLALGQRARIVIEGTVSGYSMNEWGCDASLKGKKVTVEALGKGESMADELESGRARAKKGKAY